MSETSARRSRRAGGREAGQKLRAAPLAEELRPVRPGPSGVTYRPLTAADAQRIHAAALDALEEIGLTDAPQSGITYMTAAGATLGEDGRVRFPRALVEDTLAAAARDITLHGRDPRHDMLLSGSRVHFGTAGAAMHLIDPVAREYRDSTIQDLYDAARIVEQLDNVHFLQRQMVASEFTDNEQMDYNSIFEACRGTTKHIGTSCNEPDYVRPCVNILHIIAGDEATWRARAFVSNSNWFVVPPMKFATESCVVMECRIEAGMQALLLSAGQMGATAPAPVAATITQAVVGCLAGLVYVNAIAPGHPAVFGAWPFVSDLRTDAISGGSGEQALLTAGCSQMIQVYGLPSGSAAGIADSKLPDMQAGWEEGISNVMAGLSGLNMV